MAELGERTIIPSENVTSERRKLENAWIDNRFNENSIETEMGMMMMMMMILTKNICYVHSRSDIDVSTKKQRN